MNTRSVARSGLRGNAEARQIDVEVAKQVVKNYKIEKFTSKISPVTLKAISDDMLANQQVKEAPDWKKIIDQSFMAPELRSNI